MNWLVSLSSTMLPYLVSNTSWENAAMLAVYGVPIATQLSLIHTFIKVTMYTSNQTLILTKRVKDLLRPPTQTTVMIELIEDEDTFSSEEKMVLITQDQSSSS